MCLGRVWLALLAAALVAGCGYRLVREDKASLPGGVKSVAMPLAKNRTIEAGLEDVFTQEMIEKLRADGRIIVLSPGLAEADLLCTVQELKISPQSYTREGRVATERATMEVGCRLAMAQSDSTVWSTGPLRAWEDYPIGDDYIKNEEIKALALREICRDLAGSIRDLLFDSF